MKQITELNEICDIRDLLKHLNLSVGIIMDLEHQTWALEVRATIVIKGASYGVLRQSNWFHKDKEFADGEWEREIDFLAGVIAVAMGHRVFKR